MRYIVRRSVVDVYGKLWMPMTPAAQRTELSSYDIDNIRDEDGNITRESVEDWLMGNSGDFSTVVDFSASIEDGDMTIDIPWATEEGEYGYSDCMYAAED